MSDLIGIAGALRASTERMANCASVPMELWNQHSNAALSAANEIDRLKALLIHYGDMCGCDAAEMTKACNL